MYLSISASNEQGSLTEAQWPWEGPAVQDRDQAHSNSTASSSELGHKSGPVITQFPTLKHGRELSF